MRMTQAWPVLAILLALATGCGGGNTATAPPPQEAARPTTVTVSPAKAELIGLGATVQLTAEVRDQNARVMTGVTVTWSSSNTSMATVSASGLVTGIGEGVATITASAGSSSGMAEVIVTDPDRAVLIAFYEATDGPNWVNSEDWLTDAPLGDWFGVETDTSGRVVRLAMSYHDPQLDQWFSNNASGPVPPELGDLTAVRYLQFNNNRLSGPIPPELGQLTNLVDLDFNSNDLTGQIPPELGSLSSLEHLLLNENDLSGPIPPELSDLTSLTLLWLQSNDLAGPIPESFLKLGALKEFLFDGNAGLCAPDTIDFAAWLDGMERTSGPYCREEFEPPAVQDPYPIRMHWGQCPQRNGYDGCILLADARTTYGDMIVDAAEDVVAEWSRLLHPTPRTPWVAPLEGWDRNWPDRNTPPHLWGIVPGDIVPPGLDIFILGVTDQESCGWTCATGHPVYPPGGQRHPDDLVRMAKVVVDSRFSDPDDQRWVTLHETGHAIAMSGLGNREWKHHIVKLPLSATQGQVLDADSIYIQTHPEIMRIYGLHGGGGWDWIGKDVGVALDPYGNSHWNDCSAPQDVMGPWYFYPTEDRRRRWRT